MTNNIFYTSLKYVIKDLIGDFLYWPIWWYSKGLLNTILFSFKAVQNQQDALGIDIWIKNIFTPMYGQRDWEGRLISFIIRILQIIFRSILLLIWTILMILPVIIWTTLPLIIIFQIYTHILNLF